MDEFLDAFFALKTGIECQSDEEAEYIADFFITRYGDSYARRDYIFGYDRNHYHMVKHSGLGQYLCLSSNRSHPCISFSDFQMLVGDTVSAIEVGDLL